MAAKWAQKAANAIHQGSWITGTKHCHPEDVMFSREEIRTRGDSVLGIMDGYLNGSDWLATDHATIVDISCAASISILPGCEYKSGKWDNVTACSGDLRALLGAIDLNS